MKRRILFAVMVLVTAWSVWSWAQPRPAGHGPQPPAAGRPVVTAPTPTQEKQVAAEEKAEGKQEAESEEPAPINWTQFGTSTPPYIAMLINFGILVAGYYLLGKKPIAAALQSRRDNIAKDIEEAARMRKEAEERAKVYQAKLEKLEDEVKTAREALVRAGEAERDRIVTEAEAKAERMRKDAEFMVEQELKQIRQDLWRDTVEVAIGAAEELLKKRVTPADQERLAEDYLTDLGGKRAPAAGPGAGTTETAS